MDGRHEIPHGWNVFKGVAADDKVGRFGNACRIEVFATERQIVARIAQRPAWHETRIDAKGDTSRASVQLV